MGTSEQLTQCRVCGGSTDLINSVFKGSITWMRECRVCGFIRSEGNEHDYASDGLGSNSVGSNPRIGSAKTPGREFHIGQLALLGFDRANLDILIVGAGTSQDWAHLSKLEAVNEVYCTDFHNDTHNPNYLPIGEAREEPFDIIIACEVIEHMHQPREEIAALIDMLSDDGIFIASTNIYDGTDLDTHRYPTLRGHVAYYTPKALRVIADAVTCNLDFRVPTIARTFGGPRKRYVLMTRQQLALDRIARYFADHEYARAEGAAVSKGGRTRSAGVPKPNTRLGAALEAAGALGGKTLRKRAARPN